MPWEFRLVNSAVPFMGEKIPLWGFLKQHEAFESFHSKYFLLSDHLLSKRQGELVCLSFSWRKVLQRK